MITRRLFCGCLAVGLPFASTVAQAQSSECAVFTPDRQKSTAPDEAIARLKAGNERFTAGKSINCDLMAQVKQTASNQSPYAAIVGCIDSRVAPELVFDQRIGDLRARGRQFRQYRYYRQPRICNQGLGRQGDRRAGTQFLRRDKERRR